MITIRPKPLFFYSILACLLALLTSCSSFSVTQADSRGTGDLGVVIERASGQALIVSHFPQPKVLARIGGLGDLSHASVVFSRDEKYAYVFGRDGGLNKINLLAQKLEKRVIQAGNSIGGAITQDGRIVAAQNYEPGGVKLFDADSLELLAEIAAVDASGKPSKVVGLADLPDKRLAFSLYDAGEIWIADIRNPRQPIVSKLTAGRQPYDGLISPNGRWYVAGLYGEDGLALVDVWQRPYAVKRILGGYGRGEEKLPVYKMPHLRGWAMTEGLAFLPAVGRHEVLIAQTGTQTSGDWREVGRVSVAGQPVFVMARPDGRQVWVNFAFPDNDTLQVIDVPSQKLVRTFKPCKGILHMEFTARVDQVWISCRDDNRVEIYDPDTFEKIGVLEADGPSGIFFTSRAQRMGM